MNSIIKFAKNYRQIFRFTSYSTSSSSHNIEPCDVLSNDEIDLEVCEKVFQMTSKDQSAILIF